MIIITTALQADILLFVWAVATYVTDTTMGMRCCKLGLKGTNCWSRNRIQCFTLWGTVCSDMLGYDAVWMGELFVVFQKDHGPFTFMGQEMKILYGSLGPWIWRYYIPLKHQIKRSMKHLHSSLTLDPWWWGKPHTFETSETTCPVMIILSLKTKSPPKNLNPVWSTGLQLLGLSK
jgi:hypothetical protein